ncbi:hypothetical protein [Streptomyces mutabilis]|uniref:hypothetical protein n=1 Tax=Streptomyces mutabilis TaxID=67332 RepID=UPI000A257B59|nr:hypothetical protein [Streptomyces sp. DH17]OSC70053.1 hypothetical protein B5181_10880 [Streptomyces sp. 4F]
MRRAYSVACAVTAVVTAFATGCTHDTDTRTATAAAQRAEPRELTYTEELRLSDAQQRLTARCMAEQGFTHHVYRPLTVEEHHPVGYVQDDIAWAREHGYGSRIQEKADKARLDNPNVAYRKSLPEQRRRDYDTALGGGAEAREVSAEVPAGGTYRKRVGGCVGKAEEQLYGDPEAWFAADKTAAALQAHAMEAVLDDSRFTAAVKRWSQCMRRAGHPYADPGEAREAVRQQTRRLPETKAFETEREIAGTDAACARDTSLREVAEEREAHHLDLLRGEYGDALDTARRIQRDALARAEKIAGRPS